MMNMIHCSHLHYCLFLFAFFSLFPVAGNSFLRHLREEANADNSTSLCEASWSQLGEAIVGGADSDQAGHAVSLSASGRVLAVALPLKGSGTSGEVSLFELNSTSTTSTWTQMGEHLKVDEHTYGISLSLSADGRTVAVGSPDGDVNRSGYVQVYEWNETISFWQQKGQDLEGTNEDYGAYKQFGRTVSLSADGNTVAIGAPTAPAELAPLSSAGTVRIYTFNITTWTQLGNDINGETGIDSAGASVYLSATGRRVAVGADQSEGGGVGNGNVRIFDFIEDDWTQVGRNINGENPRDYSGRATALSADGTTVAIGVALNDDNEENSGLVRVFRYSTLKEDWVQLGNDIDGEAAWDLSGSSVSISADGNTVAIGSPQNHRGSGDGSGHTRVYYYTARLGWHQLGQDIDGEAAGDESGYSVSLSADGKTIATGAPLNDGAGSDSGQVRVFQFPSSPAWRLVGHDIDVNALKGLVIATSNGGTIIAVGGRFHDGNGEDSGQVRVYRYAVKRGDWEKLGQNLDGDAGDLFGSSLALSADGMTLAVGAPENSNSNGQQSGKTSTYIYSEASDKWVPLGSDIYGKNPGDLFGTSVCLSADGRIVAAGAIFADPNGLRSGHAKVFRFSEGDDDWLPLGSDVNGEAPFDFSGFSVSLSSDGETLAVGAPGYDAAGKVQVYRFIGQDWDLLGSDIRGNSESPYADNLGVPVMLSADGNTVAIGSNMVPQEVDYVGMNIVRVYNYASGAWELLGQDIVGWGVSLSADGKTVAVGGSVALWDIGDHALVYKFDSVSGWIQVGGPLEAAWGDKYVFGVAINDDGTTAVVRSGNSSDGDGHVRVYDFGEPRDSTPPALTCPSGIIMNADPSEGAAVSFTVYAVDACDPDPVIVCEPASGSFFQIGNSTVSCTATDKRNVQDSCSFSVKIMALAVPTVEPTTAPSTSMPSAAPTPSSIPTSDSASANVSVGTAVGIAFGAAVFVLVAAFVALKLRQGEKPRSDDLPFAVAESVRETFPSGTDSSSGGQPGNRLDYKAQFRSFIQERQRRHSRQVVPAPALVDAVEDDGASETDHPLADAVFEPISSEPDHIPSTHP